MRSFIVSALAAVVSVSIPTLAARAAEPPPAPEAAAPAPKRPAPWKGFRISSDDKSASLRIGTQLQIDGNGFPGDDAKAGVDEIKLRRFRPSVRATVFEHYDLRWVVELAESRLNVLDAVLELTHLDALRLRIGKDKAPHSYDHLQSSSNTTFRERGPTARLSGNRDLGVQLYGVLASGTVDYQLGVFDGVPDAGSVDADTDDRFELAGRITFKPFKTLGIGPLEDLALGVTGSWGEARGTLAAPNVPSYRTSGRATWFRYAASTTDLAATVIADGDRTRIGGHLDWRAGPVGLFGEVLVSGQDLRLGDTTASVSHMAWQAYASVLLTGERSTRTGVSPDAPFDPDTGGAGAFELAVRYGQLTIDEAAFDDGLADPARSAEELSTLTIGLNWYLNSVIRVQLDYERSTFGGGAADGGDRDAEDFIGARVQVNL
ncbi:MAG: hypothetical protein IT385_11150 [Deltaproteobacteria bacterium]|nr:hypothetical protein [Deltaproteobacteria bacterium]